MHTRYRANTLTRWKMNLFQTLVYTGQEYHKIRNDRLTCDHYRRKLSTNFQTANILQ